MLIVNSNMCDIIIAFVPYIPYSLPPAAPAALVGHLQSCGFSAVAKDFNIDFRKRLNNEEHLSQMIAYWTNDKTKLNHDLNLVYQEILEDYSKILINASSRWIGISVFSPHSTKFCTDLLKHLQKNKSNRTKIVIGGAGVDIVYADSTKHLIDAYIQGEGELALVELLKDNFRYPGINSPGHQIENLEILATPNYKDYDLTAYDHFYDSPAVQVTGSRGCVRDCSFCDVATFHSKFRWKSGKSIANEIISIHESTGIKHFFFTDSLINGNMRELRIMMQQLADYRERTKAQITWSGQWIARKQKGLPQDYYQLIKKSGGNNLTIGVETGSDAVREHMRKGFTNQDLDDEMEQFSKYGIHCSFLMIVGYPTETDKDFKDTLDMFNRYVKYVADGTITGVSLGSSFIFLDNVPLNKQENITFKFLNNNKSEWVSLVSNSNYVESLRRRIIAQQVIENLMWPANDLNYFTGTLLAQLEKLAAKGVLNKENNLQLRDLSISEQYQLPEPSQSTEIELLLEGDCGLNYPKINIFINNTLIGSYTVENKTHIRFSANLKKRNILKIILYNKLPHDTLIENDTIVRNKKVIIQEIKIAGIRIQNDKIAQKGFVREYQGDRLKTNILYKNGEYKFYFTNRLPQFFMASNKYYYNRNKDINKKAMTKLLGYYQDLSQNH
jgi:hypothetical protein